MPYHGLANAAINVYGTLLLNTPTYVIGGAGKQVHVCMCVIRYQIEKHFHRWLPPGSVTEEKKHNTHTHTHTHTPTHQHTPSGWVCDI